MLFLTKISKSSSENWFFTMLSSPLFSELIVIILSVLVLTFEKYLSRFGVFLTSSMLDFLLLLLLTGFKFSSSWSFIFKLSPLMLLIFRLLLFVFCLFILKFSPLALLILFLIASCWFILESSLLTLSIMFLKVHFLRIGEKLSLVDDRSTIWDVTETTK